MTDDEEKEAWRAALVRNGHAPALDDDGKIDIWALDYSFHNGPACDTCHETWCMHCVGPGDVKPCTSPVIEGNTWIAPPAAN